MRYCSRTSDSGHSEIGIQYNRPLYKGHCLRLRSSYSLYSYISREPLKEADNLSTNDKTAQFVLSLVQRFQCITTRIYSQRRICAIILTCVDPSGRVVVVVESIASG